MRAWIGLIAIAAFALGCRSVPARAPAPAAPEPAPPGECAVAPPTEIPQPPPPPAAQELSVTATAYNSLPSQGVGRGTLGAWGDRLEPGTKSIAISHDLLALGLTRGMMVEIEGLPGHYTVLDRLPSRWSRRIDIYMGKDVRAARNWGKRQVRIRWAPPTAANSD